MREELKQMDQRIKPYISEMTLTDYMSRKEGGRGLSSIEDSIDATIRLLEDYIKKC